MTAYSNLPGQAVLPLDAYRVEDLERDARRADHKVLRADCTGASDKAAVLKAIGEGFGLPAHYGQNLDALYDCLTDLKAPADARQPGLLLIVRDLPPPPALMAPDRDALLDVFRDSAEHYFDREVAFRVFYSVRKAR
jgi:hypothetical protein